MSEIYSLGSPRNSIAALFLIDEVFGIYREKVEEEIVFGLLVFLRVQVKNHWIVIFFILLCVDKTAFESKLFSLIRLIAVYHLVLILFVTKRASVEEEFSILNFFEMLSARLLNAVYENLSIIDRFIPIESFFGDFLNLLAVGAR